MGSNLIFYSVTLKQDEALFHKEKRKEEFVPLKPNRAKAAGKLEEAKTQESS